MRLLNFAVGPEGPPAVVLPLANFHLEKSTQVATHSEILISTFTKLPWNTRISTAKACLHLGAKF